MAEHLALEQALRDATKVHLDKGLLHALAVDMDGFGNQLLALSLIHIFFQVVLGNVAQQFADKSQTFFFCLCSEMSNT